MRHLKKLLFLLPTIGIIFSCLFINNSIFANEGMKIDVDYYIIPKIKEESVKRIQDATTEIGKSGGSVMETYKEKAANLTTAEQLNSGIMTRDTIMNYLVFVIKFLSQIGLVIGAGFIMFAGYKYMTSIITGSSADKSMIPNAIIGVIIVIFSYAIMKTFTSIVGLT